MEIEEKTINSLRFTAVNMIELAKSGHPGIALDLAPLFYTLYAKHLRVVPSKPKHVLADRFVLSAGHGSSILYTALNAFGYNVSMADLKNFRQLGSITPGHPEQGITPGVDCSSGPLGQGVASAVGLAIAEKMMAERFNIDECELFDNRTYCIVGDGCLMEGVSYEALSLAGALKLNKLIVFYDRNKVTIDGGIERVYDVDVKKYMQSLGFAVLEVRDGNDINEIDDAINEAKKSESKPVFIILNTVIGYGSEVAGLSKAHGAPLGKDGLEYLKNNLNITCEPFEYEKDVLAHLKNVCKRFAVVEKELDAKMNFYKKNCKSAYADLEEFLNPNFSKLDDLLRNFKSEHETASTRVWGGEVLKEIARVYPSVVGGTADLSSSTKTRIGKEPVNISFKNRDILYGVREFAMASISNGLALYGFKPFCGTFFVFSDYMRGAMRMSALNCLPVKYVLTHDSFAVGEDGATHQPLEQLASLRAMPNLNVYRPCDFTEICACYSMAFEEKCPSALVLTRQNLQRVKSDYDGAKKGGYNVREECKGLQLILIATGSEVQLAIEVAKKLFQKDYGVRVVSMPCQEVFDKQPKQYRDLVLPAGIPKISIEAGSTFGWDKYVDNGLKIGIDHFGASGKMEELSEKYGFTVKNIVKNAIKLLKNERKNNKI